MSLQKRLVAVVALLLVLGLLVADVVTYAEVRSFLYGQADNTLAQNEALGFNYLTFASEKHVTVSQADLSRRISSDVYITLLGRNGTGDAASPLRLADPARPRAHLDQGHPRPAGARHLQPRPGRALRRHVPPRPRRRRARAAWAIPTAPTGPSP